jgi:hypothetical protein
MALPKDNTFHICFDTQEMPGRIVATRVVLTKDFISDRDGASMFINLRDHPQYRALETYVHANPSRKMPLLDAPDSAQGELFEGMQPKPWVPRLPRD